MKSAQMNVSSSPPTYHQLLLFLFTTVLIWLTEPLLSLVDTTVAGWSGAAAATGMVSHAATSGTCTTAAAASTPTILQLAALGPATTLYDSWLYLTYFLSMATTHKLTAAHARGNVRACLQTCLHVMGVAMVLGVITTVVMWLGAESFLTTLMGAALSSSSTSVAALIPLATWYAHICATVAMA